MFITNFRQFCIIVLSIRSGGGLYRYKTRLMQCINKWTQNVVGNLKFPKKSSVYANQLPQSKIFIQTYKSLIYHQIYIAVKYKNDYGI